MDRKRVSNKGLMTQTLKLKSRHIDKGVIHMALATLFLLNTALIIIAVVLQYYLYVSRPGAKNSFMIFMINVIFAILLSGLAFTSLPSNYLGLRSIGAIWGSLAIIALVLKLVNKRFTMTSKILLTVAIVGGLIQLLI